ncbi:Spo0E family sporulation regulatory protein-aspartic acid phosphatase [Defluviitalea phaphyphila]|uniref:Spo0E family sporulation regulatory protein-aspartic acid phosphatase n=1 Tax=Defluviitalea phaphyphila TaxID=1473580 RepID=UPI0007319B94|nr:Spo0E family sporulation regulatory protein-aspartic acid phosphatase [Defluviitalea phaphyphila]
MKQKNCTREEIELLKTALDTLLEQKNYNFLDPLVQQLSRKLDDLIYKITQQQIDNFKKIKKKKDCK